MNWYEIEGKKHVSMETGRVWVVEYTCKGCGTRDTRIARTLVEAVERIPTKCPWCEFDGSDDTDEKEDE